MLEQIAKEFDLALAGSEWYDRTEVVGKRLLIRCRTWKDVHKSDTLKRLLAEHKGTHFEFQRNVRKQDIVR